MPPRKSSQQDPGEEVPTRFDDERHEVRLVALRLRLLAVIDLACDCVSALADEA